MYLKIFIEVSAWFFIAGMCYRLSEVGLWIKEVDGIILPAFMNNEWWLKEAAKTTFDDWTFSFFQDSYHFFRNIIRLSVAVRLFTLRVDRRVQIKWKFALSLGFASLAAWFFGIEIISLWLRV